MRQINLSLVSQKSLYGERGFSSPASLVRSPLLCWKTPPLNQATPLH